MIVVLERSDLFNTQQYRCSHCLLPVYTVDAARGYCIEVCPWLHVIEYLVAVTLVNSEASEGCCSVHRTPTHPPTHPPPPSPPTPSK
jgi:hypothetical protein